MFIDKELTMWDAIERVRPAKMSDDEIDAKYESRSWRILTETNREQLPNFYEALNRPNWIDIRPFYQRRQRWDEPKQSKLIESFIMNIPVPPLFLYESEFSKYEVMDGQQRITAIREFFSNNLRLTGLEQWPELNGKTYAKLPGSIKRGIDRRSISYTVLLAESAENVVDKYAIRKMVFERLNTSGVDLSNQEIRNSLFYGKFNTMMIGLATDPIFRRAWRLPLYSETERTNPSRDLLDNNFYGKMLDVEVVLRFFALRNIEHYQRGMQGFLDLYMLKAKEFSDDDLAELNELFFRTLGLANDIFGELLFRPWMGDEECWSKRPHVAFADAVMVGVCRNLNNAAALLARKERVIQGTRELFVTHEDGTFTGRGNSKKDVKERIDYFSAMLSNIAAAD